MALIDWDGGLGVGVGRSTVEVTGEMYVDARYAVGYRLCGARAFYVQYDQTTAVLLPLPTISS